MLIENFSTTIAEKIEKETIITNLQIHPEHVLFKGHFPGNPVTPGVMMIQLFKEQAERFTKKKLQLENASNIKFLSVIEPDKETKVRLESKIELDEEEVRLTGKVFHKEMVSIKLKLGFKKFFAEK